MLKGKMMKKILALVLVMAVSVMAVDFTGVDNGDGTVTISYDAPIVGLALDVDSAAVAVDSVTLPAFFDVFMDYAYVQGESYVYGAGDSIATQDAAGVATLPSSSFTISAGGLEDDETDTVPATGEITLAVSGTGDITIDENTLRGGVVDYNGAMTTNLPITINVAGGDTPEQIQWDTMNINGDTAVNSQDVASLVGFISSNGVAPFYSIPSTDASYDATYDLNEDGAINSQDVASLVGYISANGEAPFYSISRPGV